jgi:hypothetical protein
MTTPPTGAAATSPAATAASGYRLSGTDMQPFVGQRVEITGTLAPTAGASGATSAGASATGTAAVPEFRVVSVRPVGGSCQPK